MVPETIISIKYYDEIPPKAANYKRFGDQQFGNADYYEEEYFHNNYHH